MPKILPYLFAGETFSFMRRYRHIMAAWHATELKENNFMAKSANCGIKISMMITSHGRVAVVLLATFPRPPFALFLGRLFASVALGSPLLLPLPYPPPSPEKH